MEQEGDDAGQKLAAELLRVLMATRQARLALRSVRGDQTLLDCLNAAAPQVQQSAFEALKVLYYSEAGAWSSTYNWLLRLPLLCSPPFVLQPLLRRALFELGPGCPHCLRTRVGASASCHA